MKKKDYPYQVTFYGSIIACLALFSVLYWLNEITIPHIETAPTVREKLAELLIFFRAYRLLCLCRSCL